MKNFTIDIIIHVINFSSYEVQGLDYQIKETFPFFWRLHKDNMNKWKSELSEKDSFIQILIR